jgi:2-amino-4-hydroxy-6-hydroxymethyldihydropteridine diphosphokinase
LNNSYILLGGNSGNRAFFLEEAIRLISKEAGDVMKHSCIYETEPWGFQSDITFLNQVILIQTPLSPSGLLTKLTSIEKQLGRKRDKSNKGVYSSRVIDLDILFYNDQIVSSKRLQIPHPRMHLRRFTMVPLAEIAGECIHPVFHQTVRQLARDCPDQSDVKLYKSFTGVHHKNYR